MCCKEQKKTVSKYFAMNLLNLMKQRLKKKMLRKQDTKAKLSNSGKCRIKNKITPEMKTTLETAKERTDISEYRDKEDIN